MPILEEPVEDAVADKGGCDLPDGLQRPGTTPFRA